ncbi:mbre TPR repeat protein [Salpingoeca rosetta]|uniref:Mbre TPR repeat protein n=1 Tax=Salpingoeca rosetta (strain ATCC 50818 / BSB-021) TaxID=946362 RepID=F2USK8_SALR5|nr:mbre TPR repeat protein [Salpingoeca rosetta]EGD81117.1 mbre TPR repeat protein [Salpingoeca rosetta]|eukprot:XP_004987802.1 mbre TPR repeat protein [Salpingoeca rosetta]
MSTPKPTTATTTTTTAAAPICTDGVSTSAIKRFMSQIKDYHPDNYKEVTTYDACVKPVIHRTKEWKCSYIDLLRRTKPEEVGPATVFVSHAWQYKIFDVLTTMLEYAMEEEKRHKDDDGTKKETFFWFDLFCNNQHKESLLGLTPEQIGAPFKNAIASIGKVLLVLTPWNNPIPLTRAWCLWEIFCAISQSSDDVGLEIRLPQRQRMKLREALLKTHKAITNMLVEVQAEKAKAYKEADKKMIFQTIENSVGFAEVNKAVKGKMRTWCLMMAKSFVEEMKTGDISQEFAPMCNRVGLVMHDFGEHDSAETFFQQALGVELLIFGEKHPDTATTYNNLGLVYFSKCQYDRAIHYYQKCLQIKLDTLGEKHPDTATTYNNLGQVYDSKGEYDRAIHSYQKCLQIQLDTLGGQHSETASTYNNLGGVYNSQGQYDRAIYYYHKCLQIELDTLGEEHPSTATTYNNLASGYTRKGECDRAIHYFQKCLQIKLDTLGEKHPSTATTYHNLGHVYHSKGEYGKALTVVQQAVSIWLDTLGPDHPHTKMGQQSLIALLLQQPTGPSTQQQKSTATPSAQQRQLPTQRNLLLRFISAQAVHRSSAARRNLILRFLCSALHAHMSPASAGRD